MSRPEINQCQVRWTSILVCLLGLNIPSQHLGCCAAAETEVSYQLQIKGDVITPSAEGPRQLPIRSSGEFEFSQAAFPTDIGGPFTLRAARSFRRAQTETTVGRDYQTKVVLPRSYQEIHVFGSDTGLLHISPTYSLPRKQLDLLQMPFDALPAGALVPAATVKPGDRWNADSWVLPMLTGTEAVVKQSVRCELKSQTDRSAEVTFSGSVEGAVHGSATDVTVTGHFEFDPKTRMVRSFSATQKEKRSPGPVSPGLSVVVEVHWTQKVSTPTELKVSALQPPAKHLQLFLQTPLRLHLRHSREWFLFHEAADVLMLRQLRSGNLVSQCNISTAITVRPGEHTPDREFLTDVTATVKARQGSVLEELTTRDDEFWRIRQVRAVGNAGGEVLVWDYYLCTAASGEQYSLVFSHARKDEEAFGDSAERILKTLRVAKPRPAIPFR